MELLYVLVLSFAFTAGLRHLYLNNLAPKYKLKYSKEGSPSWSKPSLEIVFWAISFAGLSLVMLGVFHGMSHMAYVIITALLILISAADLCWKKIPNELTGAVAVAGLSFNLLLSALNNDYSYILGGLLGGIFCGLFLLVPSLVVKGGMGTGDVKLAAAIGFALKFTQAVYFLMAAFVLAAVISLILISLKKMHRKDKIPLSPFMACAFVLIVCFQTNFMENFMIKNFYPDEYLESIFHIDYDNLQKNGINNLIFDIDNTIEPYDVSSPSEKDIELLNGLKAQGFNIYLVSNNRASRVDEFNKELMFPAVSGANKPLTGNVKKLLNQSKVRIGSIAFIGDQVFTDVWCARRLGVYSILVNPIATRDEFSVRLKRGIEKIVINKYLKQRL